MMTLRHLPHTPRVRRHPCTLAQALVTSCKPLLCRRVLVVPRAVDFKGEDWKEEKEKEGEAASKKGTPAADTPHYTPPDDWGTGEDDWSDTHLDTSSGSYAQQQQQQQRQQQRHAARTPTTPAAAAPTPVAVPPPEARSSLYERIGGQAAVDAAVVDFYHRILADPSLAPFFQGINMQRQLRKQAKFLTYAFGGAGSYDGKDLVASHKQMILDKGLNLSHFDAVARHLRETLQAMGVAQHMVEEADSIVQSTRSLFDPAKYGVQPTAPPTPTAATSPTVAAHPAGWADVSTDDMMGQLHAAEHIDSSRYAPSPPMPPSSRSHMAGGDDTVAQTEQGIEGASGNTGEV